MDYFFSFSKLKYLQNKKKTEGCLLCNIIAEKEGIEDLTVYKNGLFVVAVNLYPYNPGHLLIYPVRHLEDIRELSKEEKRMLSHLEEAFLTLLDQTHAPAGYNIGYNMGLVAGGSIKHLHLHIIPRFPNEIGISDLIAGKRVLVEDPRDTVKKLKEQMNEGVYQMLEPQE